MITTKTEFAKLIEKKVSKQIKSQRVAYLLGAGFSYLDGEGYPLMTQLWDLIKESIPEDDKNDIQTKINEGAEGIENALDLLDNGGVNETSHRKHVTQAIAECFSNLNPSLEIHSQFLRNLCQKTRGCKIPIFSLNYDPLIERASEHAKIKVTDGFVGFETAYFDANVLQEDTVVIRKGRFSRRVYTPAPQSICLYKLHGSVGWYECPKSGMRRNAFNNIPKGARHLMIPPQKRKSNDSMTVPYINLWSEFRAYLRQGQRPLINRLISIGYAMKDEHVNAVLESALARTDFTLIVLTKELDDTAFDRWKSKQNVIIVTSSRCSFGGKVGSGHPDLWQLERINKEV